VIVLVGCGSESDPPAPQDLSTLPVEERIEQLLAQMTLEEKVAQMHGVGIAPIAGLFHTAENERLSIPGFRMVDGPRGVRAGNATAFPVGMARGATWDVELERKVGAAIGLETAAKGGNVLLAPTINLLRHPAWGRAQETYGEDPWHMGSMGVAFIEGAQQHVIASAKHFAANSIEDTRFSVDITLDERTLREVYLPHFRRAVQDAKVGSVMSAYNSLNGAFCSENEPLLRTILKDEWGFDGFVESDWLLAVHSTAESANAGLDVEMPSPAYYGTKLVAAVEAGEVSLATIDEAVSRILRKKFEFALDAPPAVDPTLIESSEHLGLAREVARKSIVLLKNDAALPLDPANSIAVVGSLASVANMGDEGSSNVTPSSSATPLDGISAYTTAVHIDDDELDATDITAIGEADAAVVIVGLTALDEGELLPGSGGDRDSLALSTEHAALIEAVATANERTIVVVEGGSAVTMDPWLAQADAVLMAWYPGMEGGHAIAEILFGDVNPSGRLPLSFAASEDDLVPFDHVSDAVSYGYFHGYRHLQREGIAPLFPFGFGLSYTTFAYESIAVSDEAIAADGTLTVSVVVRNTGDRAGEEVVQLYVGYDGSTVERVERELKSFARVALEPGASASVELPLNAADVAYYDGGWVVEAMEYRVEVGPSSAELPLNAAFRVD